jgi:hypothetical protein
MKISEPHGHLSMFISKSYQNGARRTIWPKTQVQRGLKLKGYIISKDPGDEIVFLKRTYSVNFKLDFKPKEFLKKILEIGPSRVS